MKTKKNKKFYNFTEYQKRKDRSLHHLDYAPSAYRKCFNRSTKANYRHLVRKIKQGFDIEFPVEKKNVNWFYF